MNFSISQEWLEEHGVDILAFEAALDGYGIDPESYDENGVWTFTATDDNGDGIPDFLAGIITDPLITNVSQGGQITD